jgi:hypothetical protein
MEKIRREDVKDLVEYEKVRDAFRHEVIEIKRARRVAVGDRVMLLFENRATVLFQIQEMIRTERMVDEERIREEIEVNNDLIPADHELSATLFIEVDDPGRVREVLDSFQGIDRGETVFFRIGDRHRIVGVFETGRSKEDKISAVHYVRFPFDDPEREAFMDPSEPVELVVDHPRYQRRVPIDGAVRRSLMRDLTAGPLGSGSPV